MAMGACVLPPKTLSAVPADITLPVPVPHKEAWQPPSKTYDSGESKARKIRVERQSYIHVPKPRLMSELEERADLAPSEMLDLKRVLTCLESIYGVEYQIASDDLLMVLHTLNIAATVPEGCQVVSKSGDEDLGSGDWDCHHLGDWNEMPSMRIEVSEQEATESVYMTPDALEELENTFLKDFTAMAAKAHFKPVSARDSAMADTLNSSYLSNLFIRPNASKVEEGFTAGVVDERLLKELGGVAVFKRGWGKEHTRGRLLVPKLDMLQTIVARSLVRISRSAASSILAVLLGKEEDRPPRSAGPMLCHRGSVAAVRPLSAQEERQQRRRRRKGIHPRQLLRQIRKGFEYYGLLPQSDKLNLNEFEKQWPVVEDVRHKPVYIERITVEDCFGGQRGTTRKAAPDAKLEDFIWEAGACGADVQRGSGGLPARLGVWRLQEVAGGSRAETAADSRGPRSSREANQEGEASPASLHGDPFPLWRIVYPFKAIAFQPISIIKVDLIALAGLVAIIAQAKYGNSLLQLVWIASFVAQFLRVILQYRRMFITFENYVSKQMLKRTVAGAEGVVEFLSRSSALQQYKQTLLLYYSVFANGADLLLDTERAANLIEGILADMGAEVEFDVKEAKEELLRLGLLRMVHHDQAVAAASNGAGAYNPYEIVKPADAIPILVDHWSSILIGQLEYIEDRPWGLSMASFREEAMSSFESEKGGAAV
eukprot:CAMPEP_0117680466 /NCGR_PEP_ID=MMETSP0804-20121206/18373_1 /TAXON_ID=1074897 /ORGANISM="Tetraselmis astigmatica, Strain CCMP880" /LENGTH=711 /DNA_ID=CAMNT_0005489977 /DNA_START=400 /DNA_END=2536 /DNA_ORIENTATION=+